MSVTPFIAHWPCVCVCRLGSVEAPEVLDELDAQFERRVQQMSPMQCAEYVSYLAHAGHVNAPHRLRRESRQLRRTAGSHTANSNFESNC